jgi:hypothetical protein
MSDIADPGSTKLVAEGEYEESLLREYVMRVGYR